MNFQVPQFIDVEDRIFGPLTFKQFAYCLGGAGACFLIFAYVKHINTALALILMIPVGAFFASLAFYKINDRPMIITLEAAFKYMLGHKLYLWKRTAPNRQVLPATSQTVNVNRLPRLSDSKLRDLSWSLDIDKTTQS